MLDDSTRICVVTHFVALGNRLLCGGDVPLFVVVVSPLAPKSIAQTGVNNKKNGGNRCDAAIREGAIRIFL